MKTKDAKEEEKVAEREAKEEDRLAREKAKEEDRVVQKEVLMNEKMVKWYNERKDFVGMPKPSPKKVGMPAYDKWRRWNDPGLAGYAGARYDVEKAKAVWEASEYAKGEDDDAGAKGGDDAGAK